MKPSFDTYYNYAQLTDVLNTLASEHAAILSLGVELTTSQLVPRLDPQADRRDDSPCPLQSTERHMREPQTPAPVTPGIPRTVRTSSRASACARAPDSSDTVNR